MQNFKTFYDNEIYPILKNSGVLSEWKNDYKKYNNLYSNVEKYFIYITIFCIALFIVFLYILLSFEDWKICHPTIYYSIGIISTFGIPSSWVLSLSIKRLYNRQKKEKEKYYKIKLKKIGIYKKILQNLCCEGDYINKQIPNKLLEKSKLLKKLEKSFSVDDFTHLKQPERIVSTDDCIDIHINNMQFSIYDCICFYSNLRISYNVHNLIINFKNNNHIQKNLIIEETIRKSYPNNDIRIENVDDEIIICIRRVKDYFEICDLSKDETINYQNLYALRNDLKKILKLLKLFST